jgi:hypothetical protein
MAPRKRVEIDLNTGNVYVQGIKHNKRGIAQQAIEGLAYDDAQGIFRFRDDAFNRDWLCHEKVQLVVKQ